MSDGNCLRPDILASSAYRYWGCRCGRCRAWRAERYEEYDKAYEASLSPAARRARKRRVNERKKEGTKAAKRRTGNGDWANKV